MSGNIQEMLMILLPYCDPYFQHTVVFEVIESRIETKRAISSFRAADAWVFQCV